MSKLTPTMQQPPPPVGILKDIANFKNSSIYKNHKTVFYFIYVFLIRTIYTQHIHIHLWMYFSTPPLFTIIYILPASNNLKKFPTTHHQKSICLRMLSTSSSIDPFNLESNATTTITQIIKHTICDVSDLTFQKSPIIFLVAETFFSFSLLFYITLNFCGCKNCVFGWMIIFHC